MSRRPSLRRVARPGVLAALVWLGIGGDFASGTEQCRAAAARTDWREAARACQTSWERGAGDGDLVRLAKAEMHLGREDRALELASSALDGAHRASALQVVGIVLDRRGETARARAALREAAALFARRDAAGEVARAHYGLAGSHWSRAEYGDTLAELSASEAAASRARDARMLGHVALMRADVLRAVGDAASAERGYEDAARALASRSSDLAFVRLKQGIMRRDLGLRHLARTSFEEALTLARASGQGLAEQAALLNLAWDGHLAGEPARGFRYLAAWKGAPDFQYLFNRGALEADEGRLEDARASLVAALELAPSDDRLWEGWYARGRVEERLGDPASAARSYEEAVSAIERLYAELELTDLQPWVLPLRREPYEALFALHAREGRTGAALAALDSLTARSFLDSLIVAGRLDSERALADREALLEAWRALGARRESGAPRAGEGELVAIVEALDRVYVVHQHGAATSILDRGPAARARELASSFRADPAAEPAARELGALLLPEGLQAGDQPLTIVPSGSFSRLPFAALRHRGRFLVEHRDLALSPSLVRPEAWVSAARGSRGVVLADADGSLPAARAEAGEVARALGAELFLGADATAAALWDLGEVDVLHVALHGGVGEGGAWVRTADGVFTAHDALLSGVRARVVILAACSSAVSRRAEVSGSLAASFLANGSGAVIAAVASIDDRDTRALVRGLLENGVRERPVAALARAQRAMISIAPPRSWSYFVAYSMVGADAAE